MAGEPIDIEIRDKVADSIRTKLLNIASAALEGFSNVSKLQDALDQTASGKISAAAAQIASGQDKVAASIGRTSAAARRAASDLNAFGESEADVAKRLQAVGQAALANVAAMQAGAKAQATLATATQETTRAASGSAQAYTAQMNAIQRANAAAKAGAAVGVGGTLPAGATAKIAEAEAAMDKLGHTTVGTKRELIVLAHEILSGNFSRIPGSFLVLIERTGSLSGALSALLGLFTPFKILFALIAAAVAIYEYAVAKAENTQRKFNDTMTLTSGAAGLTLDTFNALAQSIATANDVTVSSSKNVVQELAASGRFQADEIKNFGDSAIKLSKLTGESTDSIVKDFIRAADGPGKYADELVKKGILIEPVILQQVRLLDEMGQHADATRLLSKGLYDYLQDHAPQTLTGIAGLWNELKIAIDGAADSLAKAARGPTITDKIAAAQKELDGLIANQEKYSKTGLFSGLADAGAKLIAEKKEQIQQLTDEVQLSQSAAEAQSKHTRTVQNAASALDRLDTKYESTRGNAYKLGVALKALDKDIKDANIPENAGDERLQYVLKNRAKIEDDLRRKYRDATPLKNPEDNRATIIAKANAELEKQVKYYDEISDVRNAQRAADEVDIKLASRKLRPLDPNERQRIVNLKEEAEANLRVSRAIDSVYNNSDEIRLRSYNEATQAITILLGKHAISAKEAADAQRKLNYEYDAANDPLFLFNRGIADQTKLLEFNTQQRQAQAALLQIENTEAAKGKRLSDEQKRSIIDQTTALNDRLRLQKEIDAIENQTTGARLQLQTQQEAVTKAFQDGTITLEDYTRRFVDLQVQLANLNLASGLGTFEDAVTASLGRIRDGYTNVTKGLSDSFGEFFKTVSDGFGQSIAHALVFGGSIKDALGDVARKAIEQLLGSFIKLGIQYVINAALGESALAATVAASSGAAAATALAWAEPAALVSLASFGANSIPATAALAETSAFAAALAAVSSVTGFESGGYTGDGSRKGIAGVVHGQEFVANASATARNRGVLEAMNAGATVGSGTNLVIENHGTAQTYERVPGLTADEVRYIARDEVQSSAPGVTASQLRQPNSQVSKALRDSHNVTRKR